MSQFKQKLLDCAQRGIWCDFSEVKDAKKAAVTIRGEWLREILLTAATPGKRIQALRLKGAVIEGVIDLRDCSNADGGSLPPFLLERCVLKGDVVHPEMAVLTARHAHLSRLSLTGCQFGRIDISNAVLDGDLAIDEVCPLDDSRPCQVSARRVCIRGMVNARKTKLRIPLTQLIPEFNTPDYAFDFSGAHIDGPIYLCPDFSAIGGVNLAEAIVEGSIWAIGAKIIGGSGVAFSGQSLNCTGAIVLRSEKGKRCIIKGGVELLAATAGNVDMKGALIQCHSKKTNFELPQFIELSMAKVRNAVNFSEIIWGNRVKHLGSVNILMTNTEVGGELSAKDLRFDNFFLQDSKIGGGVTISRAVGASQTGMIHGDNLNVGFDLILIVSNCMVKLHGCCIGSDLIFRGVKTAEVSRFKSELLALDTAIADNCSISMSMAM
jgi:hypothetical protein